jgi:pimeloyl-ACP methyl ester carboxylesterase
MKRPIYALVGHPNSGVQTEHLFCQLQDLRNHGTSPHAEPMNYTAMAEDVWHFIEQHGLSDVSVIGHSMYVLLNCPLRSSKGPILQC